MESTKGFLNVEGIKTNYTKRVEKEFQELQKMIEGKENEKEIIFEKELTAYQLIVLSNSGKLQYLPNVETGLPYTRFIKE